MNLSPYPWHRAWLAEHRVTVRERHHAWLMVGREGDGLAQAGLAVAASLLCEHPHDGVACGECSSCRWFAGSVHPDFVRLAPEESDDDVARLPTIKTDAARGAISFMELSASTERGRVLLVDPATALSRESANALLKAIEEPPANTRWILLASRPAKLLPTIRSRVLKLALPRPERDVALRWIRAENGTLSDPDRALANADSAPLDVLANAGGDALEAKERLVHDLGNPRELPTLSWGSWVEAGGKSQKRDRFALVLATLHDWLVDWARVRSGLAPSRALSDPAILAGLGANLALAEGLRLRRELLRKLTLPDTTLSARLQVEAILLDYRAKFA
ncbi:MAG: hypothetical protein EAZ24_12415 [Burkholderiales bacterium]|nr:MAG: hypothetical protein EAZ24_12415 [Burkholderiales bacterium]TAG79387.1 MAG: hypothetical protein EAZ21_10660 [Betaproteobacteria bacterium]